VFVISILFPLERIIAEFFFLFIILTNRLIRGFGYKVKFGIINSSAIGHNLIEIQNFLHYEYDAKTFYFLIYGTKALSRHPKTHQNEFLYKKIKKSLPSRVQLLTNNIFLSRIYWDFYYDPTKTIFKKSRRAKDFMLKPGTSPTFVFDPLGILENQKKSKLSFSNKEEEVGKAYLSKLGIEKSEYYICVNVRNTYYSNLIGLDSQESKSIRNANIQNYFPAINFFLLNNIKVILVGDYSPNLTIPKNILESDNFVYYSQHTDRNDFFDLYLIANARLLFGTNTGLFEAATLDSSFDHFYGYTDSIGIHQYVSHRKNAFVFPKTLINNGKTISIEDHLVYSKEIDIYGKLGHIQIFDNTSDEILFFAQEMLLRSQGQYIEDKIIEELEKECIRRLNQIFESASFDKLRSEGLFSIGLFNSRISHAYLRKTIATK
jgi:putative glycosyltransferase (TIGR04372 family)